MTYKSSTNWQCALDNQYSSFTGVESLKLTYDFVKTKMWYGKLYMYIHVNLACVAGGIVCMKAKFHGGPTAKN